MSEPQLKIIAIKGGPRKYTLIWALSTALHCLGELIVRLSLQSAKHRR